MRNYWYCGADMELTTPVDAEKWRMKSFSEPPLMSREMQVA